MSKKLYVGNLDYGTSSADLEQLFSQFGQVERADIVMDRDSGRSKGFAFVEMDSDESAQAARSALNGREYGGRSIFVDEARPREARPGQRGGGGGRQSGGW